LLFVNRQKSKVARTLVARGSEFCAQRAARNDFSPTQTGSYEDLKWQDRPEMCDERSAEGQFPAEPERRRGAGQSKGLLATLSVLTETECGVVHLSCGGDDADDPAMLLIGVRASAFLRACLTDFNF